MCCIVTSPNLPEPQPGENDEERKENQRKHKLRAQWKKKKIYNQYEDETKSYLSCVQTLNL